MRYIKNLMVDALWLAKEPGEVAPHRLWARALGRTLLWFSIMAVTLAIVGLAAFAVFALAHHAAPAGGGG